MKKLAVVLVSAVAFDLGTVVASSHAEIALNFAKIKVDYYHTVQGCTAHHGVVVKSGGQDYCKLPSAELQSWSFGESQGHQAIKGGTPQTAVPNPGPK